MGKKSWVGVGALAVVSLLAGNAAADHWTDPDDVSDAAFELASEAKEFAKIAHNVAPLSKADDRAKDLAEAAMVLGKVAESGWGYFFVQDTWDTVQARFDKLEDAYENSAKLHNKLKVKKAWKQVRAAYKQLKWSMISGDGSDWNDDDDNDWNDDDDNDWDDDDGDGPWNPNDDIDIVLF